jgi:RNA-directed DNA polymerase
MNNTFQNKWGDIQWSLIENSVYKIQTQIYQAIRRNDIATARNLQIVLINLYEAKLLSVRKITQENTGKNTAGIDKMLVLDDMSRLTIANSLVIDGQTNYVRRTYIPKNKLELRPLGIPTIYDRCKQELVRLAMEPEVEARFETNSYGFRPGRSTIDAISRIRTHMIFKPGTFYVFDADIKKCFDKIGHEQLLNKLAMHEPFQTQIRAWLKAGIFEEDKVFVPTEGTPQGGVISPLLANVALEGLQSYLYTGIASKFGSGHAENLLYIRYADDFLVISSNHDVINYAVKLCTAFLKGMNLEINWDKSRIVTTCLQDPVTKRLTSQPFDFLGFRFIQRYVSVHKTFRFKSGLTTRFSVNIIPAPSRIQRHKASISALMTRVGDLPTLIKALNPRIKGWCNYFRHCDGKVNRDIPRKLDLWMNSKIRKFIRRTTKIRGKNPKFWKENTRDWIPYFKDEETGVETTLIKYSSFSWNISKYKPIDPGFSPYQLPPKPVRIKPLKGRSKLIIWPGV